MTTCNVIPDQATCGSCLKVQQMYNMVEDCTKCERKNRIYELITAGFNVWGDYAIVLFKGKREKVSLDRVTNIQIK